MHTLRTTTIALLAAVAAGACERAPDGGLLAPVSGPQASEIGAANAGGAMVVRFTTTSFILVFDAARQLLAAHMPSNICTDGEFNVVEVQRVTTPSDVGQRAVKLTGTEQVAIYHATSPADAGLDAPINSFGFGNLADVNQFCAFMGGPNLIAEGTVERLSTFSLASFHARWTGTIQGTDGASYRLTEVYQLNAALHDPNNPDTFTEPVVRIQLRPLP